MKKRNLLDVNKTLKRHDSVVKYLRNKDTYQFISHENHFNIPLDKRNPGVLYDKSLHKIAGTIANETGEKQKDIYESLIKKEKKEYVKKLGLEKAITPAIIVLSVGLVTLILSQTKLLTGYAISNIPSTTANMGIIICIVGIIGLLCYRRKCRK